MKLATVSCSFAFRCKPIVKLFCRFLFVFLRGGEALRLFATHGTLPDVISAVIVPHRSQSSPACRALATGTRVALAAVVSAVSADLDLKDEQGERPRQRASSIAL
jgi:hypothetical protein